MIAITSAFASSTTKRGFYERLVLSAFQRMQVGALRLELPSGEIVEVGDRASETRAHIRVLDESFFKRCVLYGDIGFAESYIDGEWETDSIVNVITWAIHNLDQTPTMTGSRVRGLAVNLLKGVNRVRHVARANTEATSKRNIAEHYDLGNAFYGLWLDETMTYSAARYTSATQPLADAQAEKYDALCRKLKLDASHRVLEIGCGWGGFASHAVRTYGCRVTAVTISQAQYDFAQRRFAREGIADRVELVLADYRTLRGQYDRIVSIEMMEALGDRYLETFFAQVHRLVTRDGLVGLQYITVPDVRHRGLKRGVDFIQRHIFPGSLLLSVGRVNQAINRTGDLFLHDLEDLGASYARTLHEWWERFGARRAEVLALGFDERFVRKWNYYLQYCEAAFRTRNVSVVQGIYTRPNNGALHSEIG